MTIMQFDSHAGWYNPNPAPVSRYATRSRSSYTPAPSDPKKVPIESRCFFVLLDAARAGCKESQAELKLRGQTTAPRVRLW
jgi:hypothetical protein